jgi:hypothetical protein
MYKPELNNLKNFLLSVFLISSLIAHGQGPATGPAMVAMAEIENHSEANNNAQVVGGYIQELMGVKNIRLIYDYSRMTICKFQHNDAYIEHLRKKYKGDRAERYVTEWIGLPKSEFEPRFEKYFNKCVKSTGIVGINNYQDSSVTMIVEVLKAEPHVHNEKGDDYPSLSIACTVMHPNGDLRVRFKLTAYGSQNNNEARCISGCFAVAGKLLGKFITEKLKNPGKYESVYTSETQPEPEEETKQEEK